VAESYAPSQLRHPLLKGNMMTQSEKLLIKVLAGLKDNNDKAIVLQNFISEMGPLTEEAAELVRKQLARR
jgi:hypothetical protein